MICEVEIELKKYHLKLKRTKTKIYNRRDFKLITGVVCDRNGKLKVPNKLREEIIEGFNDIKNLKNEELQQKKSSLLGEIYSAGQIKPYIFSAMIRRIK